MKRLFVGIMFLLGLPALADNNNCPTLNEGIRVDNETALERAKGYCDITKGMGLFTEGVREITFPNLKHITVLNIEADDLEAVNFPVLESVDYLYISGGDLKIAEFPRLKHVGNTFHVKSKNLEFLHLPSLRTVYKWYITKNPRLQTVFADKVYNITYLQMDGNPTLVKGTEEVLRGVTATLTAEQQQDILDAEKKIREVKLKLNQQMLDQQPKLPPTGHATTFGGGTGYYYGAYPYYFYNYWGLAGQYGYHRWYSGWTWW